MAYVFVFVCISPIKSLGTKNSTKALKNLEESTIIIESVFYGFYMSFSCWGEGNIYSLPSVVLIIPYHPYFCQKLHALFILFRNLYSKFNCIWENFGHF